MSTLVDDLCQQFAAAWADRSPPRIADLVAALPAAERAAALRPLIEIDVRERLAVGDSPAAADYASLVAGEAALVEWFAQLQSLLASHSRQTETHDNSLAPRRGPALPPNRAGYEPPPQIGRYRTQRVLGAGGFGLVVAAWDDDLGRLVAIKIPLDLPGADEAERQFAEARAAARLAHPGIVPVYDCGRLADGRVYIVSEYIEGRTLADELRAGRPQLARSVALMIELAEAAHHAHVNGLFHRDLKPSNILIDRHGRPRIADFGLVIDEAEQHRFAGDISGSPPYMSPEQVLGQTHFLDGRTDVWSLGVLFYELLTGRRPFRSPEPEVLRDEILHREPRPPRQIDDSLPRELEQYCLKCLKRSLAERYGSAADLARDLRGWLQQREFDSGRLSGEAPTTSGSGSAGSQRSSRGDVAESPRRATLLRPWMIAATATAAALVLVGGGLWLWANSPWFDGSRQTPVAAAPAPGDVSAPTPVGGATEAADGATTVATAAAATPFIGPETVPTGVWIPLLDRQPRVLHWPLAPRNSDLAYREARREVTITCDQSAMIELGRTAARNFRLRARLHQPTWTGGVAVFWGYGERQSRQHQFQMVALQSYRATKNREPFHVAWETAASTRDGWKVGGSVLQVFETEPPEPGDIELELLIRDGLLHAVTWNGDDLGVIVSGDPLVTPRAGDSVGAFGVQVVQSTVLIREAAIRFDE